MRCDAKRMLQDDGCLTECEPGGTRSWSLAACAPQRSDADVVVARAADLAHPLVHLVAALLPDLQVLHAQPGRAEHGHLRARARRHALPAAGLS